MLKDLARSIVTKLASPDAHIKYENFIHGPEFDDIGRLIPHSIAGTYDDFCKMALRHNFPFPKCEDIIGIPEFSSRNSYRSVLSLTADTQALNNWLQRNEEQRLQQLYVSQQIHRNPVDLVMNRAENFPVYKKFLETDMPESYSSVAFWKQQRRFGDAVKGLHSTLSMTEKCKTAYDQIGVPQMIQNEKCLITPNQQVSTAESHILRASNIKGKKSQSCLLPDFQNLEVRGFQIYDASITSIINNEDLKDDEVVNTEEIENTPVESSYKNTLVPESIEYGSLISGPALVVNGHKVKWQPENEDKAIDFMFYFESALGETDKSSLFVQNNGSTAIFYKWKKLIKDSPYNPYQVLHKYFYFNDSNGVILPNQTIQFPFTFKSPQIGVYSEVLEFVTFPKLPCMMVSLQGIIKPLDLYSVSRTNLSEFLNIKVKRTMAEQLVMELCSSVCSEVQESYPEDFNMEIEPIFKGKNPGFNYESKIVSSLKGLYYNVLRNSKKPEIKWNYSVAEVLNAISAMDDSEEKECHLNKVEEYVRQMQFSTDVFKGNNHYYYVYILLVDGMNTLTKQLNTISQAYGAVKRLEELRKRRNGKKSSLQKKTVTTDWSFNPTVPRIRIKKMHAEAYDILARTVENIEKVLNEIHS